MMVKARIFLFVYSLFLLLLVSCDKKDATQYSALRISQGGDIVAVNIDTMNLPNPYIVYDKKSDVYFMTGDGGCLWRSNDLKIWEGPFDVLLHDTATWMGNNAQISSPEIHTYKGRYYYMATFTRPDIVIENIEGQNICRRSCEIFVSDSILGPYTRVAKGAPLLTATAQSVEHPTFCVDELNVGYMIFAQNGEQNGNAAVQIVRLGDNLDVQIGEPYKMFKASHNKWSQNKSKDGFSPLMNAPFMFDTDGGELGILFTTFIGEESAVGVAYTEKDHGLDGPWHIEPQPLVAGNVGGAMLFTDYDGTLVMALHKDTVVNGEKKAVPQLIKMDSQFDKLKVKGHYKF